MRAILDRDIILNIVANGGIDIGQPPLGAGLDRLRFDGKQLIDLMDLSEIWVEPVPGGGYILHAIEVPGSMLVEMKYADRSRLKISSEVPMLITEEEQTAQAALADDKALQDQFFIQMRQKAGSVDAQLQSLRQLVFLLINYVLTNSPSAKELLSELLVDLKDIYTPAALSSSLKTAVSDLKEIESTLSSVKTAMK